MRDTDQPMWLDHERDAMLERARRLDEARAMSEDEAASFAHAGPLSYTRLPEDLPKAIIIALLLVIAVVWWLP